MTTFVAPGPLLNLEAPLPQRRGFNLLSTVPVISRESDRWLAGSWIEDRPPGPAFTHDPCAQGTERVKEDPGVIDTQRTGRFTVYLPAYCTAQSIGPNPDRWTAKLRQAFDIYEASAVERILASGDGHTDFGAYLADENLEILAGGDVEEALVAYGLLEQAIARHGSGILHVGPRTFAMWQAYNLIIERDGILYSHIGTPIVVGYGYVGVTPVHGDMAADDEEWAFASGPLELIRDPDVTITPPNYDEALDRSLNDVLFLAERPYLLNWLARTSTGDPDHIQAGVLVHVGMTSGGTGPEGPAGPTGPTGPQGPPGTAESARAILQHELSSGTNGGLPVASSWNTRHLNSEDDPDGIVVLAADQFTLEEGSYFIESHAHVWGVQQNKTRIQDITNAATVLIGHSSYNNDGEAAYLAGRLEVTGTTTYELQHWVAGAAGDYNFGQNVGQGTEVYVTVIITKEA